MKKLGLFLFTLALVALALAAPRPSVAFEYELPANAMEDAVSGNAAPELITGTNHKYVRRTYAEGSDQCAIWHIPKMPNSYVSGNNLFLSVDFENSHTSGVSGANIATRADIGCGNTSAPNTNWKTIALNNGTVTAATMLSSAATGDIIFLGATSGTSGIPFDESNCDKDLPVVIRFCRLSSSQSGTDTYSQSVGLIGAVLHD